MRKVRKTGLAVILLPTTPVLQVPDRRVVVTHSRVLNVQPVVLLVLLRPPRENLGDQFQRSTGDQVVPRRFFLVEFEPFFFW